MRRPRRISPWVVGDIAVVAAIALFAWLALALRDSVGGMGDMATGMRDTGSAIQASGRATAREIHREVGGVADALGSVPFVGSELRTRVQRTATRTADAVERETRADGARLIAAGRQGQRDARDTARLVGWLAFIAPTVLLLAVWLPWRLAPRD